MAEPFEKILQVLERGLPPEVPLKGQVHDLVSSSSLPTFSEASGGHMIKKYFAFDESSVTPCGTNTERHISD